MGEKQKKHRTDFLSVFTFSNETEVDMAKHDVGLFSFFFFFTFVCHYSKDGDMVEKRSRHAAKTF